MISEFIDVEKLENITSEFQNNAPFPHVVVDNFLKEEIAQALAAEIPNHTDDIWQQYSNPIEIKKVCNDWNKFPPLTYRFFSMLNSDEFTTLLAQKLGIPHLYSDNGLNGGGWHVHGKGGKLNTHLDYSIHPKLKKQRKVNIIIYLNPEWKAEWGGNLGLWEGDNKAPKDLAKSIDCIFNRAVIFDTTKNSWHGLPAPLTCPDDQSRKSIAIYFLQEPEVNAEDRGKALFAPTEDQKDNKEVLELIKKRASVTDAEKVYK